MLHPEDPVVPEVADYVAGYCHVAGVVAADAGMEPVDCIVVVDTGTWEVLVVVDVDSRAVGADVGGCCYGCCCYYECWTGDDDTPGRTLSSCP